MARLHSKRGAMSEINVVPYVDVMLVLLVIFMVTAPLVTPGVIDLPSVAKAGQPKVVPLETPRLTLAMACFSRRMIGGPAFGAKAGSMPAARS